MTAKYQMVPFARRHAEALGLVAESALHFDMDPLVLDYLEKQKNSWTLMVGGSIALCGGTLQQWPGRHTAWAMLSADTGKYMLATTRCAHKILEVPAGRIEATVRDDFAAGHRWAHMLGFRVETQCLKKYGPMGEDHVGYVRMN